MAQAGAVQLHRFGQVVQQRGPGVVVPGGVVSLLGAGKIFAQVGEQGLNRRRRQEFGLPSCGAESCAFWMTYPPPMLLVLSGIPGTGKSTLARELSRRLGAVYLRVDTVEAALLNAGHAGITVEGYATAYAVAADNLALGLNVVADCVNPVAETREAWAEVAR
ncbi:hypothetical protein DR_0609 [Deinococcus radiodurans R1 = ATCC 13939 = DSM 20539]|uniref:Uncharacterized protein n=2 Tax=Deinococcus radiodurans TaxID=1299 RepID=Q9RWQ7_DEIRA|nr:hypothetical protein DR_0609 [Deinococcus radiodurans R1 = ATCC 13939 = DSM 20539]